MINFCNTGLAEIDCKKPSVDGYSVSNLLSTTSDRKKGFLVDYFVKPPVEIELKFCCSVDIKKIKINCGVGVQKSKIIQIISEGSHNSSSIVGKGLVDSSENVLVFYLRGAQKDTSGKHETFFNSRNLIGVKKLTIKIVLTESSTVPALGGLEVWGYVSSNVPADKKNSVLELWHNIQSPLNKNNDCTISVPLPSSTDKQKDELLPFKVPEEFLDPITCDIFTIPMILPSGKIVDVVTLEKFYKAEEKWGRGKSDPFTGILFTDISKPVVATSLKERLDRFLMENCNVPCLKNIPRTVGTCIKKKIQNEAESSYSPNLSYRYDKSRPAKRKMKDIDGLLEESLIGLPSFLEKPVVKQLKTVCMKCNKCELLFKLICEHFICRYCLVAMDRTNENRCVCNKNISFNEIMRYHISV